MNAITIISMGGGVIIVLYILIQILKFYGIGQDVYGIYLAFLLFLTITAFILPTENAKV